MSAETPLAEVVVTAVLMFVVLRVTNFNSPSLELSFQGEQVTIFGDSRFATDSSFGIADCDVERTYFNQHSPGDSLNQLIHLIISRKFFRSSRLTLVSKSTRRREFHDGDFQHTARRKHGANQPIKWLLFSEAVTQL